MHEVYFSTTAFSMVATHNINKETPVGSKESSHLRGLVL